jgi:Zn-dependent protease
VGFRLGSIPVRVNGSFFFTTLLLGGLGGSGSAADIARRVAVWLVVVFVSILIHELGHALVGMLFGLKPEIDLHGMGGTTSWADGRSEIGNGKSIAISLAGPFAGFLFGGLIILIFSFVPITNPTLALAYRDLFAVNIYWGIVNLLPLLPMDGGNVTRSLLNIFTKGKGEKPARIISIITCVGFLALAVYFRSFFIGVMGAMFMFNNIQALRQVEQVQSDMSLAEAIDKAYQALGKEDGAAAARLLRGPLQSGKQSELRPTALRIFAYALLIEGHWGELMPLLEKEGRLIGAKELVRFARTAKELGRQAEAEKIEAIMAAMPRSGFEFQA